MDESYHACSMSSRMGKCVNSFSLMVVVSFCVATLHGSPRRVVFVHPREGRGRVPGFAGLIPGF